MMAMLHDHRHHDPGTGLLIVSSEARGLPAQLVLQSRVVRRGVVIGMRTSGMLVKAVVRATSRSWPLVLRATGAQACGPQACSSRP